MSILLQEEKTTAPELAERFEVSRRTINRDIEDLCKAGIPIRTTQGTGGGISIMEGYRMDRTILSLKDMKMILAGLRSLDSVSGSQYYGQLMEKLQTGSSEFISGRDSMLIDLSSWYKNSLTPKIEVIQSAIENRYIIEFKYYAPSGESNRRIEPYYLVFQWSSWYVWGWCLDCEACRLFKLNRMDRVAEANQGFLRRDVPMPDFVTREDFHWAVRKATEKKKQDFSKVEFFSYDEGLCVQCMHMGLYDHEPATVDAMHRFMEDQGYALDITDQRMHHEIYLSDVRKVVPEKLRTVIRHPIKSVADYVASDIAIYFRNYSNCFNHICTWCFFLSDVTHYSFESTIKKNGTTGFY